MRCELTADPETFQRWAQDFLLADPFRCGVIWTNVEGRRKGAITDPTPATFAVVRAADDGVVGVAMRTPPFPFVISPMPMPAVETLVPILLDACPDAAGVVGPAVDAGAFAGEWSRRSGQPVSIAMRQRTFRLDAVTEPRRVAGSWRLAGERDADLLVAWGDAFAREADVVPPGPEAEPADRIERDRQRVAARIAEQRAFLWDVDGAPVSYVGAHVAVADVVRIAPVYTPPAQRGNGYASALVAAVSQRALDNGAVACSLFTDLANPTSNKIYQAIGYRPVGDVLKYAFGA